MKSVVKTWWLVGASALMAACQSQPEKVEWVSTTFENPWQVQNVEAVSEQPSDSTIVIDPTLTAQTIEGFGTCFNELGWTSLSLLSAEDREFIMYELYGPGVGANFTMGRMPIGSNDFSLDYYSYDDVDGDFDLAHFSVAHDDSTLVPFIKMALAKQPAMRLFASPWCPPAWMKYNKHYACRSTAGLRKMMEERMASLPDSVRHRMGGNSGISGWLSVDNGLAADKSIDEGEDAFIQDPKYLDAYGRYFGKFIDGYKERGINIAMVMPQNEFNSAQPYPACVWKPQSLATFIGKYLGPEMEKRGVEVYYGTIERAKVSLSDTILTDPDAAKYIKGMGFQWAGKDALPALRQKYPNLPCYQTEQECGNGKNDWAGAMHSWDLLKHYFGNGVQAYFYWNTSLKEGGVSRWGWSQNSLVTVNEDARTYKFTPEYYVLKHASHYVLPGAKFLNLGGTYKDAIAFLNADGSIVVLAGNQNPQQVSVTFELRGKKHTFALPANSINTLVM